MTLDERDLRAGLRALTAAPPPAPPDRAVRSARRWRFIKLRRAGVATVTAFAVAVPVVAFVGRGDAPHDVRVAGTPMTQWPDRRVPAYRARAEATRADFERSGPPDQYPVRWLYAGPVPGTDTIAAVWAYCDATTCDRVTVASGPAGDGPLRGPSLSVPLLPDDLTKPVGWYFANGHGTVLFALGPAEARTLTYAVPHGVVGTARVDAGVFTADLGWIGAQPAVRMADGRSRVLYAGPLGLGTEPAVGFARPLPRLTSVPAGYRLVRAAEGQARDSRTDFSASATKPYRVFVRCVGPGPIALIDEVGLDVPIPCDGKVHPGPPDSVPSGGEAGARLKSGSDPYTVFALAFGERT
jgi:hypothetical protein